MKKLFLVLSIILLQSQTYASSMYTIDIFKRLIIGSNGTIYVSTREDEDLNSTDDSEWTDWVPHEAQVPGGAVEFLRQENDDSYNIMAIGADGKIYRYDEKTKKWNMIKRQLPQGVTAKVR